jgi:hypothetical protein
MLDFFYRHGEFPTIEGGVEKEEEQDMMKTKNGGALANGGVATAATRVEHRRPVNVSVGAFFSLSLFIFIFNSLINKIYIVYY